MAGIEKWLGPDDPYPPVEEDAVVVVLPGLITVSQEWIPDLPMPQHNCAYADPDQIYVIEFGQIVDQTGCCLVCGEDLNEIE
jgi:hypothetical protein